MSDKTAEDRAYDNASYVPDADGFRARWTEAAKAFRDQATGDLDIAYGSSQRERYDLFYPEGTPHGLAVFIHGGYWMAFDKSSWSHLATGPLARGYAVMVPSYPLCPKVSIRQISKAVGAAITHAAGRVEGPILIAGHSAGGHLAARMACVDAPLAADVSARIERVVPISALSDLRPLMATTMNETLGLTAEEARSESPALCDPANVDVVVFVGDGERPQLRRQSQILAMMWEGLARSVRYVEAADRHHFDVIADLAEPESALTSALVES